MSMNIEQLEALGISREDLIERIVDQAVDSLLNSSGYDPENDSEIRYESRFKREIQDRLQKAVDAKISALAEVHLIPKVGEMIEKANLQKTNQYGEAKGGPMTFIEYIASRADAYMAEDVDYLGKSKSEGYYNWRKEGPRLTVLMRLYIKDTLDKAAKSAVSDVNKVLAQGIEKAAREAIAHAAAAVKVSVSA